MAFQYSKEYAETQLIGTRKCLISHPHHRGVLTTDIEKWEEFLKKNYPDSEVLIKEPDQLKEKKNKDKKITTESVKKCKNANKKNIPAAVKRLVWNTNIGEDIGKSKCMCCESTDITQLSFNCGHIIAEAKGGATIVSNLKPICQNCNSSMGTINMSEFMKSLK
jgi:hypothetical protein